VHRVERELLPTARELGVGIVAWGPLRNDFLARQIISLDDGDFRHNAPRFKPGNLERNDRFAPLRALAAELGLTPAQLALAWLLHQGDDIVPIPSTRSPAHLAENITAAGIRLDAEARARIEERVPSADLVAGAALLG
jgi:aryl-alcohol dehydrogenase-like predicted oxidoreductase